MHFGHVTKTKLQEKVEKFDGPGNKIQKKIQLEEFSYQLNAL